MRLLILNHCRANRSTFVHDCLIYLFLLDNLLVYGHSLTLVTLNARLSALISLQTIGQVARHYVRDVDADVVELVQWLVHGRLVFVSFSHYWLLKVLMVLLFLECGTLLILLVITGVGIEVLRSFKHDFVTLAAVHIFILVFIADRIFLNLIETVDSLSLDAFVLVWIWLLLSFLLSS